MEGRSQLIGPVVGCVVWVFCTAVMRAAEPNGASELPASSLRPPRGEIKPSFWEQHGVLIIIGSIVVVGLVAVAVWLLTRPKAEELEPYAVTARRDLRNLAGKTEDAALLVDISRVLRRYVGASFSLPPVEMTTREFCEAMSSNSALGAPLAREISEFLQRCDVKKFAPAPPPTNLGAVTTALGIVDRAEQRLTQLRQSAIADAETTRRPKPQEVGGG